ncbi:hypothetical protein [Magnetospirillum molischianum]|uniref:Uncharacterized protein n=1 Tax=Magnetospirillum molischianum DSM 120 TaxID=1150626 RepID=H8FNH5_MAGML|nr:hypothetical protein [Magnetospirillum molischianum]CCG39913.1 hypothetical protein PHAMO_120002 [Magnetospirillum molischianum DSM 120]CCG39919.1 hypothetical protein PHAMO_120008 [Magnetospirillum molischianum DSM 120]CCG39925.1 hypothetical protein PHAMO_120014 [Magnetospirillum molischianum DSM 120]
MSDDPPKAKTAAERKREERARKAEKGVVTVALDVPTRHVKWMQNTAAKLRKGGEPPGGFRDPVPLEIRTVEVPKPIPTPGPVRVEKVEVEKLVPGPVQVKEVQVGVPVPRLDWLALLIALVVAGGAGWVAGWLGHGVTHPPAPPPYGVCAEPLQDGAKVKDGPKGQWCWVNPPSVSPFR